MNITPNRKFTCNPDLQITIYKCICKNEHLTFIKIISETKPETGYIYNKYLYTTCNSYIYIYRYLKIDKWRFLIMSAINNKSAKDKVKDFVKDALKEAEKFNRRKPELERISEERISYAKTKLMKMESFFAMLLFKMPTYPSYDIPTAATDGTVLLYNPEFVAETILRKDLVFILLHEVCHVFWKHTIRGPVRQMDIRKLFSQQKDLKKRGLNDQFLDLEIMKVNHMLKEWNFATDYVINGHINKYLSVPFSSNLKDKILINKDFTDLTSEQVYDKIKTPFKPEKGDGSMDLGIGGVLPQGFGSLSEEEVKILEKEFNQEVQSAAIAAKNAGKLPAEIEDVIDSMYKTYTPWQDVFRTIFTSINKQDYTFLYPNKRYTEHMMEYGVVMPSLWGEEYVNCGFIMDTSGSVGHEEKRILASELQNILEDYNIKLHILYCDTKAYVNDVEILTRDDIKNGQLQLKVKGGGGTCMRPAFDYFRENQNDHDFQVVICLTDMYLFDWGNLGPKPEFSTYWACLPNHDKDVKPDFGTKIEIILDKDN